MAEKTNEKKPVNNPAAKRNDKTTAKFDGKTYLIMFQIEGHKTWRIGIHGKKEFFDQYLAGQVNHPKVTTRKWFVVNKHNATITEE